MVFSEVSKKKRLTSQDAAQVTKDMSTGLEAALAKELEVHSASIGRDRQRGREREREREKEREGERERERYIYRYLYIHIYIHIQVLFSVHLSVYLLS